MQLNDEDVFIVLCRGVEWVHRKECRRNSNIEDDVHGRNIVLGWSGSKRRWTGTKTVYANTVRTKENPRITTGISPFNHGMTLKYWSLSVELAQGMVVEVNKSGWTSVNVYVMMTKIHGTRIVCLCKIDDGRMRVTTVSI